MSGTRFSSACARSRSGIARPLEASSRPSCSQSGRASQSFAIEAQRAGALKRRDFAASTCGAFPRHSAASRLQSSNPLSPQVRARPSRESANRCFVASRRARLTAATSSTRPTEWAPFSSDAVSSGTVLCSAQRSRRLTSKRLPLNSPKARSCHARNPSGLTSRSSGALFQLRRSTLNSEWRHSGLPDCHVDPQAAVSEFYSCQAGEVETPGGPFGADKGESSTSMAKLGGELAAPAPPDQGTCWAQCVALCEGSCGVP